MESRGIESDKRTRSRPAIARRSIGCDRGSPCSHCVVAKVNCTHSAVAFNTSTPKQRVLISAQYEKKIDDIAKGIDGIKLILQNLDSAQISKSAPNAVTENNRETSAQPSITRDTIATNVSSFDHSAHVIDLLKSVLEDGTVTSDGSSPETSEVVSSLTDLTRTLEDPSPGGNHSSRGRNVVKEGRNEDSQMPPVKDVLEVLRWVRSREHFFRISRISRVLPAEYFAEVCRKMYFAIDKYTEIDFVLANGYLTYIFAEHLITTGLDDYREHWLMCRKNLHDAVAKLPLLLPASMDAVAALTVAAYDAMENAKATVAWSLISSAASLCQTLGYHRPSPRRRARDGSFASTDMQESLFWSVYSLDKGLSLQLDRPPNIRDVDISFSFDPDSQPRSIRLARIQGKAYGQLYSPQGLSRPVLERGHDAEVLATQLREMIRDVHVDMENANNRDPDENEDPLRVLYLQCHLVCHTSLLTLILRAIPSAGSSPSGASDECVAVARLALEIHHQCMTSIRNCKSDPQIVNKYISWAILNMPFVSFSVLFLHAVRTTDDADLAVLDRFARSLQPEDQASDCSTHPHRIYELLCRAARLQIESKTGGLDGSMNQHSLESLLDIDVPDTPSLETIRHGNESFETDGFGLGDWYREQQHFLGLLNENAFQ
ncbi:C6 transcription factor [Colletotrichum kahawae]|uniref:C6 transcription factor n=1 Tax=Colletotrichum kahawae TaxID=34407 RepID=A0AAD9XYU2_COLKA|nr:C6 transcription factor [Colletotrichum kahawae]